jgi:hypothetical protein
MKLRVRIGFVNNYLSLRLIYIIKIADIEEIFMFKFLNTVKSPLDGHQWDYFESPTLRRCPPYRVYIYRPLVRYFLAKPYHIICVVIVQHHQHTH